MASDQIPSERSEVDAKLKLIGDSYAEVLDATKHQDDKIGRLLTSVAFLTAATLALAALASAAFVTRSFDVPPFVLPLGLIALAVFLVGVVFTVMLLLVSLATPLRLPGLAESPRRKAMTWARGVPASQVYFYEIAGISLDEWERKWGASVQELKEERLRSLVRETHNLGLRTNSKYDRTTEAAALLSGSLLAFALAIVLVASAASSPSGPESIRLEALHRVLIGGIFGFYFWVQLITLVRYARQSVDEIPPRGAQPHARRKIVAGGCYAFLLSLLVVDVVVFDRSWPYVAVVVWVSTTIVLALGSVISFWLATAPDVVGAAPTRAAERRRSSRARRGVLVGLTVFLTAVAVFCGLMGWYAGQLGAASAAVLGLIVTSMLGPTFRFRHRRREFWSRHTESIKEADAGQPPEKVVTPPEEPPAAPA